MPAENNIVALTISQSPTRVGVAAAALTVLWVLVMPPHGITMKHRADVGMPTVIDLPARIMTDTSISESDPKRVPEVNLNGLICIFPTQIHLQFETRSSKESAAPLIHRR